MSAQTDRVIADVLSKCQYKYKDQSKRDISSALGYFKELNPLQEKYTYPNGITKDLVSLKGTIPVNFKNNRYNIPIQLYLSDSHPYQPPIVYVRPTPEMSVNVNETVDSNGRVMLPCLTDWSYPNTDLYMLLNFMTIKFSEQTPLYAKMNNTSVSNNRPQSQAFQSTPYPTNQPNILPYPADGFNSRPAYPMPGSYPYPPTVDTALPPFSANPYPPASNPYYPSTSNPYMPAPQQPAQLSHIKSGSTNNLGHTRPSSASSLSTYADDTIKPEHFKMSLISAIQDKIKKRFNEIYEEKIAEIESLRKVNSDLEQSKTYLDSLINDSENERENITQLTQELKRKSSQLSENLNRLQHRDKANIEDAVVTPTPLYRQLMQLFAEELAIQDYLFYLSEGLAHKTINLENFLKQIRMLTRKQFILRATMQKAREKAALPI